MTYTLVIDGRLPGLNDYTLACRQNRFAGANMKKKCQRQCVEAIQEMLPDKIHTPIAIVFRWYEQNQRRDLDNICFAKKFILDALVESGRIDNDNWRYVQGFMDEFFVNKDFPHIEVEITEL